jgi:hypothetical protein
MSIELATDQNSGVEPAAVNCRIPARYSVLRDGSTTPEVFIAFSDEDALKRIRTQVRSGGCKAIYLYKLMAFEAFESSSVTVTGVDLEAALQSFSQPQSVNSD